MGDGDRIAIERLPESATAEIVSVLAESFFDYPVMRFVLGPVPGYAARLERLLGFFVRARLLRDEPILGIRRAGELHAAALISFPWVVSPAGMEELRRVTWDALGPEARARYQAHGAAAISVEAPHIHLNMIGVRRAAQGRGLARALLDAIHALSASQPSSTGVTLSTELSSNVPLYRHFGYEVVGSAEVSQELTTWTMYRRDPPGPA